MTSRLASFLSILLVTSAPSVVVAFSSPKSPTESAVAASSLTKAFMTPRFNGEQWEPASPEEEPSAGYGPTKTLLMWGPKPWFNRIFQKDQYEQAVLKFMAQDSCGRMEAQGNMDKYLANPNDWAFDRMEMQKRGIKYDYTTLDQKQLVLTLVWSTIVVWFFSTSLFKIGTGEIWQ